MRTPVAFLIFNRPDATRRVFESIRDAKPPLLLVVADGPRPDRPDDARACTEARSLIDRVDWNCEVRTNYSDVNLGCGKRVSSGIDWVFQQVEEAIILEDDCVPDPTFFRFCEELLEKYRHDERISEIGGVNYGFGRKRADFSYYFSHYNYVWGWASWRRAWKGYDFHMETWPELRDRNWLHEFLDDPGVVRYYTHNFNKTYAGEVDTWDYQWFFHCWVNHRLAALPCVNLVTNIGYKDLRATHTKRKSRLAEVQTEPIAFSLTHPPRLMRDREADRFNDVHLRYGRFSLLNIVLTKQKVSQKIKDVLAAFLGRR